MSPTMVYQLWDEHLIVLVHTKQAPRDVEWAGYCADIVRWREQTRGVLVVSDGGGPTSRQRTALELAFAGNIGRFKTAIVTRNRVARNIVTILGWITATIKALDTVPAALEYLEVAPDSRDAVVTVIHELRRRLALTSA